MARSTHALGPPTSSEGPDGHIGGPQCQSCRTDGKGFCTWLRFRLCLVHACKMHVPGSLGALGATKLTITITHATASALATSTCSFITIPAFPSARITIYITFH